MYEKRKNATRFAKEKKNYLGMRIQNYIDQQKQRKTYTQTDFAKAIDKITGDAGMCGYVVNGKKVSRWINGDVFPDMRSLLAIAQLLGITLDELFQEVKDDLNKTKDLSPNARNILKTLIQTKQGDLVSLYFPYAFNDELLFLPEKTYTREEVVDIYKTRTTIEFRMEKMREFFKVFNNKEATVQERHFPHYCSCIVLECLEEEAERITYKCPDFYEKIEKVWQNNARATGGKLGRDEYCNVLYFIESIIDHNTEEKDRYMDSLNFDPHNLTLAKATINKVYENAFHELISKGIITPQENETLYFEFEGEENSSACLENLVRDKQISMFAEIDGAMVGSYQLETILFNFRLSLTDEQIKQFLKTEIEITFAKEQ